MHALVMIELDGDGVSASSRETLTLAHRLAGELGEAVEAVVFGDGGRAAESGGLAVSRLHQLDHPMLATYSPELWGESLHQLIARLQPSIVLGPGSDRGLEVMAQAAARADAPLVANCTTISLDRRANGDPPTWTLTRARQGGLLLEDAAVTAPTTFASTAAGAVEAASLGSLREVPVESFTPELDGVVHTQLVDETTQDSGVTLATARIVVSGGRGVGSAEGFEPLEELAKLTGGAVGCSRVATNNGWRPHSDQVGQTGTKISPDLYIACGISGATQHWVGCMNSKAILAINTDPEAPLLTRATYGVIGDVGEVVPAIVDEIHRRTLGNRQSA
ncbi:electron transfer flavoprotein subunit alpha/FixB family protein [Actinobacteria bacterium YIM 96077]|uniref:Electron transfer flavoprotein subunit alpha/FixB family protein n=1 Tax=Phytoactinopolyspora halophila TaxID=1981511 RepID=A0A329QYB3_9ACTN|nr:electron transfer flavoprotein subunit alpha/FixB family protein [Phytoactinopolyspora halophila]AYY13394.1 electron transfer flavoprotein subunit alpha/FixB family protein [Actinobacteria bacterium YIM 96077]RAW17370.1 electron transfer flavoprotein subunit alpha/FixB family protein [Phytoactinopolyspora halophila]